MQATSNLYRCFRETEHRYRIAVDFEVQIGELNHFFDNHLDDIKESPFEDSLLTLSVWLWSFCMTLNVNTREWSEIRGQLYALAQIRSIPDWLHVREQLEEREFW